MPDMHRVVHHFGVCFFVPLRSFLDNSLGVNYNGRHSGRFAEQGYFLLLGFVRFR
ncbi:hypothetical protein Q31b_34940 [Novipirellula aureliae]|uniref:Uncharacterized protein n=1 Tax=Novipirellula aureliae TaxID=2527966 RepID=A0A5C6DZ11_9BACT|nr:hypothetical protein Q31b_34940 [Novipirellula aureliae]